MPMQRNSASEWDKLIQLPYDANINSDDGDVTLLTPERTLGVWLALTPASLQALKQMVSLALTLRQKHVWFELVKSHSDLPNPILAEIQYRIAAFEVIKAMEFPLIGGDVSFSEDPCPEVVVITVTEARSANTEEDPIGCIPDDPDGG
jgi:hypothetical protein